MAIFPNLELEDAIQISDKTRLSGTKSFVSKDEPAISLVEINPEDGVENFVDVTDSLTDNWFLDWEYSGTSRTVTVSIRVTAGIAGPVTFSKTIEVLTEADDKLFSDDQDLIGLESDIVKWVRPGRNSFLDFHRKSQFLILDFLNNDLGIRDYERDRITKDSVVDVEEVRKWSKFWTLALIFEDISNATDDVFSEKNKFYMSRANAARDQSFYQLDLNKDGEISDGEIIDIKSTRLLRR